MYRPKIRLQILEEEQSKTLDMIISRTTSTRVVRSKKRLRTSQVVLVTGLTGVQFCNHTSDSYIKSIVIDKIGQCLRSPIPK